MYQIQVVNAAQAGAQWAITNAWQKNAYSPSSIKSAGTSANNSSLPSVFAAISVPTISITQVLRLPEQLGLDLDDLRLRVLRNWALSAATAPSGNYVQVVASGTFTPFSKYGSFFPLSYSLSSTATVRVQ